MLRGGVATPPGQLPQDFVFPSKRRCQTLDDLVQGCQYEWEEARDLLARGDFAHFFNGIGRMDLARVAQEAQAKAGAGGDPDAALHNFLAALPVSRAVGPKLDFSPRRLVLKNVKPGEIHILPLKILNQGKGLLQGKVTVAEGESWLRVDSDDGRHAPVKAARDQDVILHVDTRNLAAPQSYSARLTVITNGGIAEVPVRLDLGVTPFPVPGPFKGATQPKELAERMRKNPKAAVPLLEDGAVQNWFAVNGWTYPIYGIQARGVAAVQQFFEGLGLSRPPPLQLSESEVHCVCVPPEVLPRQVSLFTGSRKWVYAQVDSDSVWLKVTTPNVAGPQSALVGFEVDSSLMDEGQVHHGYLTLTANAGQRLTIHVIVDVQKPHLPLTRRLFGRLFALALIAVLYRLIVFLPGDLFGRVLAARPAEASPGTLTRWAAPAAAEEGYLRLLVLATWWVGALVGFALVCGAKRRARGGEAVALPTFRAGSDLLMGVVAGAMLGVIGAVTVGCVVTAVDFLPRALAASMASSDGSAFGGTLLWLVLVLLWWAALGAALGLLPMLGKRGREVVTAFRLPFDWMAECVGFKKQAALAGAGGRPAPSLPVAVAVTGASQAATPGALGAGQATASAAVPVAAPAPPIVRGGGVTRKR
jgi:hypothetical protein